MLDYLRSIDAFPKAHDDYRVKTNSGALGNGKLVEKSSFLF
jgi:hypothetical protein